jgi:hypothetical protein
MENQSKFTYQIHIEENTTFTVPESIINSIGAGDWLITFERIDSDRNSHLIRDHQAFLNGYDSMDEGLYDDYA